MLALLGDRHRAGRQPYITTQTYLVATAYPKHIVKLSQPKPARAPNRMVCTAARSAWALRTIGRAVLCDAHSRE